MVKGLGLAGFNVLRFCFWGLMFWVAGLIRTVWGSGFRVQDQSSTVWR